MITATEEIKNGFGLTEQKQAAFKKFCHELTLRIQRMGFWVLILIALGAALGIFYSRMYFNSALEDSIKMQRMIHADKIYDITISPIGR